MTKEKLTPRSYQEDCANIAVESLLEEKRDLFNLVPGAGKSLIFSMVADKLGEKVLIVAHNSSLVYQNYLASKQLGLIDVGIYCSGLNRKDTEQKIIFCTVKSAKNTDAFNSFKYIIIDEADINYPTKKSSEYHKFFKKLGKPSVIGFTGTSIRLYNTMTGPVFKMLTREANANFDRIAYNLPTKYVVDNGYWCKLKYISYDFDDSTLELNTTGVDYTDVTVQHALKQFSVNNNCYILIRRIMEELPEDKILLFCHTLEDAEIFQKNLEKSAIISYATKDKERVKILEDFDEGVVKCLINLNTMKQGANFPDLKHIIIGRPLQLRDYCQVVGRGVRNSEGKTHCNVYDFCNNVKRYGKIENIELKMEKDGKYQMYSGDKRLTDVYNDKIDRKYENVIFKLDKNIKFLFRFKNKPYKSIPISVLKWVMTNVEDCQPEIRKYLG